MKVYRVEHKTSKYNGVIGEINTRHWWGLDAPRYNMRREDVCGVTSLGKLKKWFPARTMREVHEHPKLQVLILDVPKLDYKDELQVVFKRRTAKVIGRLLPDGKAQYHSDIKRS